MYFLDSKDTSILYGDTTASHPEPKALYQRESVTEEERKTKALDSRISKKWIPNAYLFDPKFYRKDNGDFDPNTKNAAKEDIQHFIDLVKQNLTNKKANIGIIALNDCARFAFALMRIMKYNGVVGQITSFESFTCDIATSRPSPVVADTFMLKYDEGAYHGITIVAKDDGGSFVGLEAHASKLRKYPDFHLYTSMADFVERNFLKDQKRTGQVQTIPNTAKEGIVPTYGLTVEEMGAAWSHLESLAKKDAKTIFKCLQAPEDPSVTTYVPALTRY
ncbi:MAG: hypothetical protein GPJ13_21745 [Microcystis aeruginosa W11-06]|nr:hypothetical protein [Microcystis aeruginosa W11-06]